MLLTARVGSLRDWLLFSAAALTPAIAVGALGLRAVAHEEDSARREVGSHLTAVAARLVADLEQAITRGSGDLQTASVETDLTLAATTLRSLGPSFATPVLLGEDRALLLPSAPSTASPAPVTAASSATCRKLAASFPSDPPTIAARRAFLEECSDATSSTGRFLWPVVALDPPSKGLVSDEAIVAWIQRHAALLSEPEREATRAEASEALSDRAKERALGALSASWSRRDAILAALGAPAASRAFRAQASSSGLITWRGDGSIGALRRLPDGRYAGFVVDPTDLSEALASGSIPLPSDARARVVSTGERPSTREPSATLDLAPGLELRVTPADPSAVARLARQSRALLASLGALAVVAAFALVAALFARMRAARRSSALRTDFVAAVSHELRTPITSVRMLAELLDEGRVEAAEQPEIFQALSREARRLGDTVDRLLRFSRMAAGRYSVDREETRVAAVVAAAIDTFEERFPEGPLVDRQLDDAIVADLDAGQVRLAVDNLLANARKYAPDGAPYVARVALDRGGVAVTVADHGPGIARRDRARIFEPFERADDRLSRATEGAGIGLSLVRHVAAAHGGEVTVASEEGEGAAFTLWFPGARRMEGSS